MGKVFGLGGGVKLSSFCFLVDMYHFTVLSFACGFLYLLENLLEEEASLHKMKYLSFNKKTK